MLITSPSRDEVDRTKREIMDKWEMQDNGRIKEFLGIKITRDRRRRRISLGLTAYIKEMVNKWLGGANEKSWVPMLSVANVAGGKRCEPQQAKKYQELVLPANPGKFPGGLKKVVDEIKSLGLKAGIYFSAGVMTCGHHIGSLGYEDVDAKAWSDDGFEYLKYHNSFSQGQFGNPKISFDRYNAMSQALNKTSGDPILYSMCNWGED
ncbi:hypothetical protein NDA11_003875 [Ustilago hordei]|nr:hypothetical protein NDA11_003875 [Ustilago hordei]